MQRSAVDGRAAAVGGVAGEGQRARAFFDERSRAGNIAAVNQSVGAVEDQRGVVDDVASDAAVRAVVADLQRSAVDGRAAGVGDVTGQVQVAA